MREDGLSMLPAQRPPDPPDEARRGEVERDEPSLAIVHDMVKTAIELQFKIAERIDTKIRAYFGFVATVYAVAQAIVLKSDVHNDLGSKGGWVSGLAIAATIALLGALITAIFALRPQDEKDVSEPNLQDLLERSYAGDKTTGGEGINLLIGELKRRKATNATRIERLNAVMVVAGVAAAIAVLEVALAVEAVT